MVIGHGSATTRPRERTSVSPRGRVAEGDEQRRSILALALALALAFAFAPGDDAAVGDADEPAWAISVDARRIRAGEGRAPGAPDHGDDTNDGDDELTGHSMTLPAMSAPPPTTATPAPPTNS